MERTKEAEILALAMMSKEEREAAQALLDELSKQVYEAMDFRTCRERIKTLIFRIPHLSWKMINHIIEENDDPATQHVSSV
ncbi:hypothetical protein JTE90_021796 [Oedothorax gibbosus]|uniref:Uncharacterized protein n=1 Tax=Oedothorax gibbosus TaxID=931172 RepID=A0AAV6TPM9_9ARAC|nr:hypothetical protein JTE90_021796 [Oedothorax gibbosus]